MSSRVNVDVVVDDSQVDEAQQRAERVVQQIDSSVRRALTFTTLTLQAIGVVVDEAFRVQAELIALSITTAASLAISGLTVGNVARVGQLVILQMQLQAIRQGRQEAATRLGAAEQLIDLQFL